ncbi:MAG: DUF998 domain-containing protein [Bacteroidales bacterium]|nr:DUF998 domain-containing protein [Bacteroidales bacterium]
MQYISLLFFILSISLIVLAFLIKKELTPVSNLVSEYVYNKFGWLTKLAFVCIGLGGISYLTSLSSLYLQSNIGKTLIILLNIWSVSAAFLAVFPIDLPNKKTLNGLIHKILANIAIPTGLIIIIITTILNFNNLTVFQLFNTSILSLLIILGKIFYIRGNKNYKGIFQRIIIFSELIWFILNILQLA